jgi:adenine phosphoribosyltransferase
MNLKMEVTNMDLASRIRNIKDFPQEGIIFRDITTLLKDSDYMREAIDRIVKNIEAMDFDYVVGMESRGFLFGMPVAYALKKGFIPIRKKGKLPAETISTTYNLEYGQAEIEMHKDAIKKGDKVVIVDDLIATGGTAKAAAELVEKLGGKIVAFEFLIELENLNGREFLDEYQVDSIIKY